MRFRQYSPSAKAFLATLLFLPFLGWAGMARAQNIVVLVNDEPITSYDVAQRERWMARTSGFGDRMKAALSSDAIKQKFRQMMIAANPRSQAEAQQVAERIKKQLIESTKQRVLAEGASSSRKAAIEALIEDRIKLQAAKKNSITVSDKEVEESLSQRVGADGKKPDMNEFYHQFESDGISRKTILEIFRAQIAWRELIRRQYGPRIASLIADDKVGAPKAESTAEMEFSVRVLRLNVSGGDQRAASQRLLEAENLREKFKSCAELPKQAKLVSGAEVKAIDKAKLASFPKDIQPLILKATEGQMTPPVIVGNAVESYAICKKAVAAKAKTPAEAKPSATQQEFERFSKRYLQDLKQAASIDYRGS